MYSRYFVTSAGPQITAPTTRPLVGCFLWLVGSLASVPTGLAPEILLVVTLIWEQPSRPGLETPSRDGRPPRNSEPTSQLLGVCVPILRRLHSILVVSTQAGGLQPSRIFLG